MFEWHDWATIVASPATDDGPDADSNQRAVDERVERLIAGVRRVVNEIVDVRWANARAAAAVLRPDDAGSAGTAGRLNVRPGRAAAPIGRLRHEVRGCVAGRDGRGH